MAIRVPCTSTPLHSAAYGGPSSSRCYGFASSMSQTLSAAGGWSCFILVRSTQFLELYCPLQIHAQCGVDIHVCMISLHSFLLSKPLGVWLSLTLFFLSFTGAICGQLHRLFGHWWLVAFANLRCGYPESSPSRSLWWSVFAAIDR